MEKDLNQALKDISENPLQSIQDIKKTLDEALRSIPKLEFPEIKLPKFETEIQSYLESLPEPAVMEIGCLPAVREAAETIRAATDKQLSFLTSVTEVSRKFSEEIEKALAPLKRQFEIAEKVSLIGEMGWTALPGTFFESYLDCPIEKQEETDAYFMELLKDDIVETLLAEIVSISDNDIADDVMEAILDYRHGRYKSSAMIMFSLIDGVLIRIHEGEIYELYKQTYQYKRQKKKRRPVGEAAANNITEYYGHAPASFHFYQYVGLKTCLPKLFIDANDFSIPEHIINRNLVSHGMLRRKVEKKDCLQLFLLFANFIKYIKDFNEKFGSDQSGES